MHYPGQTTEDSCILAKLTLANFILMANRGQKTPKEIQLQIRFLLVQEKRRV